MSSDWHAPIDAYCERLDASFWSEPVNALSNAGFLLAAAAALARWRRDGGGDWPGLLLIVAVAVIGIGSFLFHTVATRWARLADVIPIGVFIYGYFSLAMARYFGVGAVATAFLTLAFAALSAAFARGWIMALQGGPDWTNGSFGYVPAAMALAGVGGLLIVQARDRREDSRAAAQERAGRALILAAAVFVASLAFRTIDLAICSAWPLGTHFLWHLLNALVLFILLRTALAFRKAAVSAGP